jgi:hypothetical protein
LLYASRDSLPPGTDLVGALMSLFGVGKRISDSVTERIFERIGAIASQQAQLAKGHSELTKVAENHAGHFDYLKSKSYLPEAAKVLHPAA